MGNAEQHQPGRILRTHNELNRTDPESSGECARFAFVIPAVHPRHASVADYATIDRVLRLTVSSMLAQAHVDTSIVVVCHVAPPWSETCSDRVHFLVLEDHPGFAPGRNKIPIDKGMKHLIGSLYALHMLRASHVMPADHDDFVDSDLARFITGTNAPARGSDGWIFSRGYQAVLRSTETGIELNGAFRVAGFDLACGTCRVFHARALAEHIARFDPERSILATDLRPERCQPVPAKLIDRVVELTDGVRDEPLSFPLVFGRHHTQSPFFGLKEVRVPLVAKGCGHGNHAGPRKGAIHWRRIRGVVRLARFAARFGLADLDGMTLRPRVGRLLRSVSRPLGPFRVFE